MGEDEIYLIILSSLFTFIHLDTFIQSDLQMRNTTTIHPKETVTLEKLKCKVPTVLRDESEKQVMNQSREQQTILPACSMLSSHIV